MELTDLITRMDRWLSTNRADYYGELRPGAKPEELSAFESQFGLTLPPDFRELYRWRNGHGGSASLQDNRMFMPLDDITSTKDTLDGMIGTDFDDPKWWRKSWIPFLANGGGDYLCLDLTAEDGGAPGQLRAFWHDWDKRQVECPSLEAWLRSLVDSMEQGTLELS